MPHTIKSAPQRFTGLRPTNRAQRRSLVMLIAVVVCAIAFVAGLFALQGHWQQVRELTWSSAQGTVVDVRQVLAGQFGGNLGGAMLYQTQVLARYTTDGSPHEQWITVSQGPRGVDDAGFQTFRFKGRPCIVRWNPSKPEEIVVEISSSLRRGDESVPQRLELDTFVTLYGGNKTPPFKTLQPRLQD